MAIAHTNAFLMLKERNQALLDSVVLLCQAVPALKAYIKAVEKGAAEKLPDSDHFKGDQDHERLRSIARSYRENLGKMVLLSTASYFEAYFHELVDEFFSFHGGVEALIDLAEKRRASSISNTDELARKARNKLSEVAKRGKEDKYEKCTRELREMGFVLPSSWMGPYGLRTLHERAKNARLVDVPDILRYGLAVPLCEAEVSEFHRLRGKRNDAAHGKLASYALKEALSANKYYRALALKADRHMIEYLFLSESP